MEAGGLVFGWIYFNFLSLKTEKLVIMHNKINKLLET